jgi:predicted metal-dependent hydrolase
MTITELEINGKKLPCHIRYKNIRHAYLRIKPNLHLEVSLPRNKTISADSLLKGKRLWIEKKIKELSRVKRIFNDGSILYGGEYIRVEVRMAEKPYVGVRWHKKAITIYGCPGKKNDELLADFLAGQTMAYIRPKAVELSKELGVTYNSISTKKIRSWGYCTRQGNLFFNGKLICLPERLVDFVVFHELLHLKHFNHSKRFRNAMAKHFADYKELKAMLKTYITTC